jgi:hypothetical protein
MIEANEVCPHCGSDQRGPEIPREYRREGSYGPYEESDPPQYFHRTIAVEIRGVYDGGLFYQCPDCGKAWHRWGMGSDLHRKATFYINEQNRKVDAENAAH